MSNDLKVGDYIRGSHRGIHQILRIYDKNSPYGLWVETKQVITSNFYKPRNNKTYHGVLGCCVRVSPSDIQKELDEIIIRYHEAMELISK